MSRLFFEKFYTLLKNMMFYNYLSNDRPSFIDRSEFDSIWQGHRALLPQADSLNRSQNKPSQ